MHNILTRHGWPLMTLFIIIRGKHWIPYANSRYNIETKIKVKVTDCIIDN